MKEWNIANFQKQEFLKCSKLAENNICCSLLHNTVTGLKQATLLKKNLEQVFFSELFQISKNASWKLLVNFYNFTLCFFFQIYIC